MPAPFNVQSIAPKNGMRKVLLSLTYMGKTNYVHVNVTPEIFAGIFGDDVREGDAGAMEWRLLKRAGTNGTSGG